jgi:pimeloyl-ACP methyl ester carboxylesterase
MGEVEPGRRMNLYCQGTGSPTVVFDSGGSDWSSTWALIQPALATRTRTCSYDRPGMGYSDPARRPSTPLNIVSDLRTLLARGGVTGPLVLVGHSLGGFNMKLYAAMHPDQVAGAVLVDPAPDRSSDRVIIPALKTRFGDKLVDEAVAAGPSGFGEAIQHYRDCADKTRAGKLDDAAYADCTDPVRPALGPTILAERRRLQSSVAYQDSQLAEIASCVYAPDAKADAEYARLFGAPHPLGDMPLVVLTHSIWDMSPPFGELGYAGSMAADRQTAALSTRGSERMVGDSHHNIQVDHPQAVIDAVADVLDAIQKDGGQRVGKAGEAASLRSAD